MEHGRKRAGQTNIRKMVPEDHRMVATLVAEAFASWEPLTRYLAIDEVTFRDRFVAPLLSSRDTEVDSFVAVGEGGDIVGAILNERLPCADESGSAPPCQYPDAMAPIIELLDAMEGRWIASDKSGGSNERRPSNVLHLFMVAVARSHMGMRIATALVEESVSAGRERGYDFAVAEATNPASLAALARAGFRVCEHASVVYRDFVDPSGNRPFHDLVDPPGCQFVVLGLSDDRDMPSRL